MGNFCEKLANRLCPPPEIPNAAEYSQRVAQTFTKQLDFMMSRIAEELGRCQNPFCRVDFYHLSQVPSSALCNEIRKRILDRGYSSVQFIAQQGQNNYLGVLIMIKECVGDFTFAENMYETWSENTATTTAATTVASDNKEKDKHE